MRLSHPDFSPRPRGRGTVSWRRAALAASLLALPLALSGCVVAPTPGYYGPGVSGGVYVAPRPYYYRPPPPFYGPRYYGPRYGYGYGGWRRW